MKASKWQYVGDVNRSEYGGKDIRHVGGRCYQIIELINMDEACGRDNKGQSKYVVELKLVDLDCIPSQELERALSSCGWDADMETQDSMRAEACESYGLSAPLDTWEGNNYTQLLRQAYRRANELLDAGKLEKQLERPANKLGSTAREMMAGNIFAGMQRGVESGNPSARIVAKMYGIPQETIDDIRPDDWLPYFAGYSDAMAGAPKQTHPDTSPEYFRGYDRAENVKAGRCPKPGWIQSQENKA